MSDYLIHRKITLKSHHVPTGETQHTHGVCTPDGEVVSGPELPTPSALMIAQLPTDRGYYLLYLDEQGNEITDTYHDSLEKAVEQAKWEFQVEPDEWEMV